jgi:hypothetical protein
MHGCSRWEGRGAWRGEYTPVSGEGQHPIAHELIDVVQQLAAGECFYVLKDEQYKIKKSNNIAGLFMKAVLQKVSKNQKRQMNIRSRHSAEKSPVSSLFHSNGNLSIQRSPSCPCGGGCPRCRGVIQPKLVIGQPGDIYEQEADRIADQVMAIPAHPAASSAPPHIQRYSRQSNGQTDEAPSSVNHALASPGRPLEPALRQDMERRFGHDFSQVRVHADSQSAESARAVNAQAYKVDRDVVFAEGQYEPETHQGHQQLAHELTHVVQQQSASQPILQRQVSTPIPGWNFTPADFAKLQSSGKYLTIAQDSSWFPAKLQANLLNTLRFLLGPKISPPGTEGVNVLDFFHGHLVVDRKDLLVDPWTGKETVPEQAVKHAEEFEKEEKGVAAKTLGGQVTQTKYGPHLRFPQGYPVTQKNVGTFTKALEKILPRFGNVLDEAAKVPGAAVMYHTFELTTPSDLAAMGQKLRSENPRRHYVTPLDTNTPRQYSPPAGGYEKEYLVIAPFSFLVDGNGAVHVRPFAASAGSGFTSLELSTVTGTPFKGEPFPIP